MQKYYLLLIIVCSGFKMVAQEVNIPDAMFRYKLFNATYHNQTARNLLGVWGPVDTNNNGIIEAEEAAYIKELDLDWLDCCYYIESLEGIQAFTNLEMLDVSFNHLTDLDVSGLVHMWSIECRGNTLASINVSGLTGMQYLNCSSNALTSLDVSGLNTLGFLECQFNQLTSLEINNMPSLSGLRCYNNQLTTLDLSTCPIMSVLECEFNQLGTLDVTNCPDLSTLNCNNNQLTAINFPDTYPMQSLNCSNNLLTAIDVSGSTALWDLNCRNNQLLVVDMMNQKNSGAVYCDNNPNLEGILIKNGWVNNNGFTFSNCPNLKYICIDDNEEAIVNTKINQYGLAGNVHVNNYCSFVPGGAFYTIQGGNKFDLNNNGCDAQDIAIPNLAFNISGLATGSFIANQEGQYSIPVQAGFHTITPVLENPSYFTISPASAQISFPSAGDAFTQNFCLTLTTPKPDLEVVVYPIDAARPGFDAKYVIVYKNKGNTLQNSGTVTLTFEDEVLDLVSATPTAAVSGNVLSWNFSDLYPFEMRSVEFTVNVNSPMETPAVNEGTLLAYTANISSPVIDVMPLDNTFRLDHTVVNSFDPNDKTCLEGDFVTPDMAGKFVHYMIRFENTGTFPAQNIVVKDVINTAQFDVASLVPMNGSHPYVTRITGNKVEFIFENINLPFDDATNDGYVVFKIKTKASLGIGDSFTNAAGIYFDYNFPIITEDATTTIQLLGTQDFAFADYFSVHPNPAGNTLSVTQKGSISGTSASIYNTLGQLVLAIPQANGLQDIEVSSLQAGAYFIKIFSGKGASVAQFLKK